MIAEENEADYFDPDTGELILGDIIISVDKLLEQAELYGHSTMREFAFLVAHSMLQLCGYDHMVEEEAAVMERKQEEILNVLREYNFIGITASSLISAYSRLIKSFMSNSYLLPRLTFLEKSICDIDALYSRLAKNNFAFKYVSASIFN